MPIRLLYKLTGTDNFRDLWDHVHGHDAHPLIQFAKYGLAGGLAFLVHVGIFYALSYTVIPAIDREMGDALRARNALINNALGFVVANFVAYVVNFKWVFKPGRHSKTKELTLFYVVSLTSWGLAVAVQTWIIWAGHSTHLGYLANIILSVMINYTGRKFLVFKG